MKKEIFGSKQKESIYSFLQPTVPKMLLVGVLFFWGFITVFPGYLRIVPPPKVEVEKYVVQKNEIVILQDTRTDKFTVHTSGDTLELEAYQKIVSYPTVVTFYFMDEDTYRKNIIPDESDTLIEF